MIYMMRRSETLERAVAEYSEQSLKISKLEKELEEAGLIIQDFINVYALHEDVDDYPLLPYDRQPSEIQRAIDFVTEVIDSREV